MAVSIDEQSSAFDNDSDDELDWEEVHVPLVAETPDVGPSTEPGTIEITLQARKKPKDLDLEKKALNAIAHAERVARVNSHKLHTLVLIANALMRNNWINDPLLHARLMSLTPLPLQNAFAVINKTRIPDSNQRGRAFEAAVTRLAEWWTEQYFHVEETGHVRSKTFEHVQRSLAAGEYEFDSDGNLLYGTAEDEEHEIVKSSKSLMKHALLRRGSRDVSAQLFTALCRALGVPARLVVSLQSVPWKAGVGKPKPSGKKRKINKGKEKAVEGDDNDDDMEEVPIPGVDTQAGFIVDGGSADEQPQLSEKAKGKQKAAPVIRLRKTKSKATTTPRVEQALHPTLTPPVFWTEVFSRADARWLPVDPIRIIVNKRKRFDPGSNKSKQDNRMLYVLAVEEDGYARDVTPRYALEYGSKVAKMQRGGGAGKSRKEWWDGVVTLVKRPYNLHRDDVEDDELQSYQITEGMPTSMAGFKDHPLYALARHLKREEVIHPLVELGKFRGEPVYPRGNVHSLKTAENWTRQGRRVREGCQPMKWVKQRAVTVNRKRAVEMALAEQKEHGENEDGIMQGLYSRNQTELYIPDPIIDGKIPRNDFGNIDLYVPSMLPQGAAFIPHKAAAKIARQLGFDYAEAVTSFEFKQRKAFPVISGVVVATENEEAVLEAYWEAEHHRAEKEEIKRQAEVLKRWTRLIQGLRIRQRLMEQYQGQGQGQSEQQPRTQAEIAESNVERKLEEPGGFLTAVAGVVQHYSLPRNPHEIVERDESLSTPVEDIVPEDDFGLQDDILQVLDSPRVNSQGDVDDYMEDLTITSEPFINGAIKTMQQLAEDAVIPQHEVDDNYSDSPSSEPPIATKKRPARMTRKKTTNGAGPSTPATSKGTTSKPRGRRTAKKRTRESGSDTEAEPSPKRAPAVKRTRTSAVATSAAPSDRVLRTRKTKTGAELDAERQRELEIRRAAEDSE